MPVYREPPDYMAPSRPSPLVPLVSGLANLYAQISREERARKLEEERFALARQEAARREQEASDEAALKKVTLRQNIAANTDLTTMPTVEKQVTEGVNVNPAEAAYAGVEPGFKPQETVTTQVPNAPRSAPITYGGEKFDIPLKYKQDIEGEAASKADQALEREQRGDMVYLPGVGMIHKALIPFFAAQAKQEEPTVVNTGDRMVGIIPRTGKEVWSTERGAPPKGPGDAEGSWVTDAKGQRVFKTKAEIAAAPVGTYSDIRPPAGKVMKADPAKLKMAIAALGGPDQANSLWSLATQINTDRGIMAALKGVARRKFSETAPEIATQTEDEKLKLIRAYNRQIQGFASSIAKAFGESGVLTNQDIARATGLFPKPGESPESTVESLVRIQQVMLAGMSDPAMFREIFGRDPVPVGSEEAPGAPAAPGAVPPPPPGFTIDQ